MARVETKHYAGDLVGMHQSDGKVLIQMSFDASVVVPLADLADLVDSLLGPVTAPSWFEIRVAAETAQTREELAAVVELVPGLVARLERQQAMIWSLQESLDMARSLQAKREAASAPSTDLLPCSVCGDKTFRFCPACKSGGLCGVCGCPHCGRRSVGPP